MTTARNLLYAQLTKVLAEKSNETVRERVQKALENYRVQIKPGAELPEGITARESLLNDIVETCTMIASTEIPRRLQSVFENYRMQAKKTTKKTGRPRKAVSGSHKEGSTDKSVGKKSLKMEPLGGGPQKRSKARGECPKCHSKGVVLAHSYSGDDYFSCIYCGFQAYRAIVETDLDMPLAAELLGRRFDEKKEFEPDDADNEQNN